MNIGERDTKKKLSKGLNKGKMVNSCKLVNIYIPKSDMKEFKVNRPPVEQHRDLCCPK